ncbi:hypothetical protein LCGC14_0988590 [marine sediment metagenome]|uniref:Uncharacterized protein n=1 Tax=marine sediment metagenome TaxID=412755 RepID=A0A0F9N6B1_9ZZZZ
MDRCPHIVTKGNAEENLDYCTLAYNSPGNMHVCLLVSGAECLEWQAIQSREHTYYGSNDVRIQKEDE